MHPAPPESETAVEHTEVDRARSWKTIAWALLPILLVVLGYGVTSGVDAHGSGRLGLIEVMPISYFVITAALGVSFVLSVRRPSTSAWILAAHILALILLLHGIASWIEESPRFAAAHTHVGFIEYIQREDKALPSLDARMSWPAFFAMGAMLDKVAGVHSAETFLLWAPLLFNLVFAPLVWSLARAVSTDRRVAWIVTYLWFALSWVGQDYYSPQATNFVIFLAFVNVLFRYFRAQGEPPVFVRPFKRAGRFVARKILRATEIRPNDAPLLRSTSTQRVLFAGTLVVLYTAMIVSHQITPIFLLLDVVALVVLRSIALRGLPLLMGVAVFTWISYGAIAYWSGHLDGLFGGFGQVGNTVGDNVGKRVNVVKSTHVWVIYARLAVSGILWSTALLGVLRRVRARTFDLPVIICFLCPFLILAGQSYGGEVILRVFVFSLPFAAILAVFALIPRDAPIGWIKTSIACLVAIAITPVFMVTRFGNEQFEYISKDEVTAVNKLFEMIEPNAVIVNLDPNTPVLVKDRDKHVYLPQSDKNAVETVDQAFAELSRNPSRQSVLFMSNSQAQDVVLLKGKPRNWDEELAKQLDASGKFKLLYKNRDAYIYALAKTPTPVPSTPATPRAVKS